MKTLLTIGRRLHVEDKAAEVTELGIVLALIVAGCVATIALIGPKIKQAYDDTNGKL